MSTEKPKLSDKLVAHLLDAVQMVPVETTKQPRERWTLLMLSGKRKGKRFPLPHSGIVRLGRAKDNWICFDGDTERSISQHHAEIEVLTKGVTIRDVGSSNGTVLNGTALNEPVALAEGDIIELGASNIRMIVVCE